MLASLPPDLFLEIFRRLESAAALRCTGVCKPWRRAIIGNAASCVPPGPPRLAASFPASSSASSTTTGTERRSPLHVRRRRRPGPSEPAPAVAAAGGLAPYDELLSSRDGLVIRR
jgi:hypothetical protein